MTVAAATLCAPLVAAVGLAAIAAAGGEKQPEMGSLAGAQGLRGTTVEATSPAPTTQAPAPTTESPKRLEERVAPVEKSQTDPVTDGPQRQESPTARAPTHNPPVQTTPKPRSPRVGPPAPTPPPTYDPTGPGAPTSSSGTGGTGSSDFDSGSTSGPGSPDGPAGQSGDD